MTQYQFLAILAAVFLAPTLGRAGQTILALVYFIMSILVLIK